MTLQFPSSVCCPQGEDGRKVSSLHLAMARMLHKVMSTFRLLVASTREPVPLAQEPL